VARILVIDDEPAILETLYRLFTRKGYEIVQAASLTEARAILASDIELDAILTDVELRDPATNRIKYSTELYRELRTQPLRQNLGFVVMTGGAPEHILELYTGVPFIEKPIEFSKLLQLIATVLAARPKIDPA
jgi:CheY-like chemotaxis protein